MFEGGQGRSDIVLNCFSLDVCLDNGFAPGAKRTDVVRSRTHWLSPETQRMRHSIVPKKEGPQVQNPSQACHTPGCESETVPAKGWGDQNASADYRREV